MCVSVPSSVNLGLHVVSQGVLVDHMAITCDTKELRGTACENTKKGGGGGGVSR
jgi:hypothetical protein